MAATDALRRGRGVPRVGAALALFATVGACENFVSSEVGEGIGAPCQRDSQCQASTCMDGICAIPCPDKCPSGTLCASGICQLPLNAGFMYPGFVMSEDYSSSFDRGRDAAKDSLPYSSLSFAENITLGSEANDAATSFLKQGRNVIVGASSIYGPMLSDFADQNPDATVLVAFSRVTRENLIDFETRTYEAYYLAGVAAATKSTSGRLGMIGSTYSPPTVASINGFALGAQSVNPAAIVELKWIGRPHDPDPPVGGKTKERIFTEQLIADGCDVIAHTLDNNIPVAVVSQLKPPNVLAIGANLNDACTIDPAVCLGAVYYNWGPFLTELLDEAHKDDLPDNGRVIEGIQVSTADSPIGFAVNDQIIGATALKQQLDPILMGLASDQGVGRVFDGPIASTGQCEAATMQPTCVEPGDRLSEQDLEQMCWLVQGVVSHDTGTDMPATVPEEDDCAPMTN
jgi:basic membrane lipoprotein Med (substrate-binding protein (PBP1-ABC) superfamily)